MASEKSYLEMSDEELLNELPPEPVKENEEPEEEVISDNDEPGDQEEKNEETTVEETSNDEEISEEESALADDDEGISEELGSDESGDTEEKEEKPVENKEEKKEASNQIDYKAEYEKLLSPFKANGKDISVKSVDDAIALMQMGANYHKKMAALKPSMRILKLLENHKLLDEAKLSFLIDLDKKDPGAINKLVKDSKIDPMDIDSEKADQYKGNQYTVNDKELELDTVLLEIQDSPGYSKTLEIVVNTWDINSKRVISDNPELLRLINDHVDTGIYDVISAEVESEQRLGRLKGLSDLEAYRQVGDAIQARGGFNHLFQGSSQDTKENLPAGTVVKPKPKKETEDKLEDKRKAAGLTKSGKAPVKADFNPLNMSDEEFEKFSLDKFL